MRPMRPMRHRRADLALDEALQGRRHEVHDAGVLELRQQVRGRREQEVPRKYGNLAAQDREVVSS